MNKLFDLVCADFKNVFPITSSKFQSEDQLEMDVS